ncbi:hypothetical protein [Candidatus Vondammii sp. HM_W22]|uniref:hypothetical protein n=1 Tax=Candidatus Vondammii sp. HM_W22 TaxID=2687299 RepID=UPI001F13AB16|nr:hypothetical protein [Candidatus Vondammii sp. HM_W22]
MIDSYTEFRIVSADAAIVPVPRQRNTREENRQIKAGDSPERHVVIKQMVYNMRRLVWLAG